MSTHTGVQRLVRDLNHLYQATPALHERDCDAAGFEWIDCTDSENTVVVFVRRATEHDDCVVIICNLTPVVREGYRIGVPLPGPYLERLNSDSTAYAGSGVGNLGEVEAEAIARHGRAHSLNLTLPPLATLVLQPITRLEVSN